MRQRDGTSAEFFGDFDRLYGEHAPGLRPDDPGLRTGLAHPAPFFFGPDDRLFGCLHRPLRPNGVGVLLCNAVGHEHHRGHRSYHVLAHRLALAGQTVLRFDYRGTGDSQGSWEAGSLSAWIEDAVTAIRELRSRAGVSEIRIVGRRLGTVVAFCAAQREETTHLGLWDPVVRGADYFAELAALHDEFMAGYHHSRVSVRLNEIAPGRTQGNEFLGASFSTAAVEEFEGFDMGSAEGAPAPAVLWLESRATWSGSELPQRFRRTGAAVELVHSLDPPAWDSSLLIQQMVPAAVVDALVAWCSGGEGGR